MLYIVQAFYSQPIINLPYLFDSFFLKRSTIEL
jgi:hypothetical protein